MYKKLLQWLGGTALIAVLLVGCGNDNNPPNNDNPVNDEDNVEENIEQQDNNNIKEDINEEMHNEHYPESEDKNVPGDGDMMKDNNTPVEDPIEDKNDMQDADNKDE
ncbi:hypothetical protein CD798_16565 [Bacillaceae bacterium SAOS 7]|nr:hypothetical protein CD798_16565 [Bacillaceae bacterium SAOS 7]